MAATQDRNGRSRQHAGQHQVEGQQHVREELDDGDGGGTAGPRRTLQGPCTEGHGEAGAAAAAAPPGHRKDPRGCARLGLDHPHERHPRGGTAGDRRSRIGKAVQPGHGPSGSVARERQAGSAVVDFVLVSALVTVMFVALLQLTLVLHVRNTVADAASSAARYGALGDRTAEDARNRAAALVAAALGPGFVQDVSVSVGALDGMQVMTVSIKAPLPVIGLLGPSHALEVSGHAVITR
ncbi:hypothetical protein CVV67_09640 [Arthrobacter stackebrandtii]|nr:hypothetical protein CVV67_09640 [Arthrobacter stackebrandtii]